MMAGYENVILTDIDGVVLNWFASFDKWMNSHGHFRVDAGSYDISHAYGIPKQQAKLLVRLFNESAHMGYLSPFRDSVKYMKKLHEEHGYVFHAITSQSSDNNAQKLRIMNLKALFGETLFDMFTILGCGDDKDEALELYRDSGCLWVEDKVENAQLGLRMGLDSILMGHVHNRHCVDVPRVKSWREIYETLV